MCFHYMFVFVQTTCISFVVDVILTYVYTSMEINYTLKNDDFRGCDSQKGDMKPSLCSTLLNNLIQIKLIKELI